MPGHYLVPFKKTPKIALLRIAKVPNDLYEIMKDCWVESPEQRPTFATISERLEAISPSFQQPAVQIKENDGFYVVIPKME
jgi:hypothetical protein